MDRREARVTMDRPRFAQGLTFDGYKRQMTRNRERFEENERRVELRPDDVAAFQQLPRPLHVLVLAEDWCGDVIANLPSSAGWRRRAGSSTSASSCATRTTT